MDQDSSLEMQLMTFGKERLCTQISASSVTCECPFYVATKARAEGNFRREGLYQRCNCDLTVSNQPIKALELEETVIFMGHIQIYNDDLFKCEIRPSFVQVFDFY